MGRTAHLATRSAKTDEVGGRWHLIDAKGQTLGRLATQIAVLLRGKHQPLFTPHVDTGDFVVVVNAKEVALSGRKREQKTYYRHSGYAGSIRSITAGEVLESPFPDRVLRSAVRGMLPKNRLGRKLLKKVKIYPGPEHPHAAQKPEEFSLA